MNRLLVNMKNKVADLRGSVEMCDRLLAGDTIILTGFHTLQYTMKESGSTELLNIKNAILGEIRDLTARIDRME